MEQSAFFLLENRMLLFAQRGRLVCTDSFPCLVSFGEFRVDFAKMVLVRNGGEVPLTATEFRLLAFLLCNAERIISRRELLRVIWGYRPDTATRTVDIHVAKLRQKLERDPANPIHVRTVHCVGYQFVP